MTKMKKLLSVLLAVVLTLSCMSVMGSAAKTAYQSVENLEALGAYSPYGQVTRLSTEERMSIVADSLDILLASLNLNMGTLLDFAGLTLTVDLRSIDAVLGTLDQVKSLKNNGIVKFLGGLLGIVGDLNVESWDTGMTRANKDQLYIVQELLTLLSANSGVVDTVLSEGLDLGLIKSFLGTIDLDPINEAVTGIPALIKGMIFPMFERWDQTIDEVNAIENALSGDGGVITVLDTMINNYFTKAMSLTTVKATSAGVMTSDHTLPTGDTHRRKFRINDSGKSITVWQYQTQSDVDAYNDTLPVDAAESEKRSVGYLEVGTYFLEQEMAGSETYVYKYQELDAEGNVLKDANGNLVKTTLKHYEDGSYWLPDFVADKKEFHISQESGLQLLYKMIPYVFEEMAPVVLNGSVKKLLSGLFGVSYEYIGKIEADGTADDAVKALPGYDASLEVFGPEGEYLWEWSAADYMVVDGVEYFYYRFQDQLFQGDTSNANEYLDIFNWDFKVTGDFMDEFVPAASSDGTGVNGDGYARLLMSTNNFLVKVANLVFNWEALGITAPVKGDNSNIIPNIQKVAQAFVGYAPWNIFGYELAADGVTKVITDKYYDLFMAEDTNLVLTGIAAFAIEALAPQAHLPSAESIANQNLKVGAVLAAILRELATQILPSADFDALIYTDYNSGTFVAGKDNSYWLDVILTIGVNLGFKYLTAFADMNEDSAAWTALGYSESVKYDLATFEANPQAWEKYVDYIIDWALTVEGNNLNDAASMCVWHVNNLVSTYTSGLTIDLASNQDPWEKLNAIFDGILFLDQFSSGAAGNNLETNIRGTILDLVNLNWGNILGTPNDAGLIDIPQNSKLITDDLLDALSLEIRDLVNGLFIAIGGGNYYLIPTSITNLDQLATQTNVKTLAVNLVAKLETAYNNGLLTTVLPFVNFFLGWKTDPQILADPVIRGNYRDGNDYVFAYNSSFEGNSIDFTNNSSGMLEKHRNSTIEDHEYAIQIDSISHDATTNSGMTLTMSDSTGYCSPYETIKINFGGTYSGEEAICVTVTYHFIGKDGNQIGDTYKEQIYCMISNQYEDSNYGGRLDADKDEDYVGVNQYQAFYFVEDVQDFYKNFQGTLVATVGTTGGTSKKSFSTITYPDSWLYKTIEYDCNKYEYKKHDTKNETYFTGITNQSEAGWASALQANTDGVASQTSGYLYKKTTSLTEEEMPYGAYDPGSIGVKYGSDTKVFGFTVIHYNDYGIDEMYDEHMALNIMPEDVASGGSSFYNTYKAALKNVVYYAKYPMMTVENSYANSYDGSFGTFTKLDGTTAVSTTAQDYVKGIMPKISGVMSALENAYDALKPYLEGGANASATEGASVAPLKAFLDEEAENEINFQDYKFYEYFNFADLRTASRNIMAQYTQPEVMDTYYIMGSGITEAELNNVIAAEENENIAAGITASRMENDAEAIAASQEAHDNWVSPTHTKLWMDNQVSALKYYKAFAVNAPVAADKTFITRELDYANANYPMTVATQNLYTVDSWARYADAHAAATAITGNEKPSEVFSAKYELMVAMKNLLLKEDSAIVNGATADLIANAEIANEILAAAKADLVLSDEAIAAGVTVDDALADLISALGYYYVGEDGNTWNLYADSALEYIDNDRPNKSTNIRKINTANANLEEAIALFDMGDDYIFTANGETTGVVEVTSEDGAGLETGYIYGITAGDAVADYITYEGCYVEYVASDLSAAGTINGTGAVVNTYTDETKSTQIGEYTVIVFGDVNGDASADGTDSQAIMQKVAGASTLNDVQTMAGNVNNDTAADGTDSQKIMQKVAGAEELPVNPYVAA